MLFTTALLKTNSQTRMHSSRMRTGRSLTVCWRLLPGGGGVCSGGGMSAQGGSAPRGVWSGVGLVWGDVCSRGSGPGGVVSQHALSQTPPLWTESQMPVKTLPCELGGIDKYQYRDFLKDHIYLTPEGELRCEKFIILVLNTEILVILKLLAPGEFVIEFSHNTQS